MTTPAEHLDRVADVVATLRALGFTPVLVGGMALVALGSRRVTRDFDFVLGHPGARLRQVVAALYDRGRPCGAEANMCKYAASEAAWQAANAAMDAFGGYGLATEYGIERKFREARLYLVAPVSNNLVLAHVGQHVLGLPRSF